MIRVAAYLSSVAIVLSGALLVPLPVVEAAPGTVTAVEPLLEVDGEITPLTGDLNLLTVLLQQPSIVETVRALVSDERVLRRREDVIPTSVDRRTYFRLQEEEFRRSFRLAVAVGLRSAGLTVGIRTAPQVISVTEGGPADGILQVGDLVREINGRAVSSSDELAGEARRSRVGDEIDLVVERAGERLEVTVVAGQLPGLEQAGIGITLQTLEEDIELPRDVDLVDQQGIGGPSAGLMIALTVHDLVAEEDLAAGRRIAGTGTIDGDGRVGRVGSVREKTLAAVDAGADLLLVPAGQEPDARAAARGRVPVVGVETMRDALAALREPPRS